MSVQVQLLPMYCVRCRAPLPAKPDETAWVCLQCGQGNLLSDETGLAPVEIHYAVAEPGARGRPFWVVEGAIQISRKTFNGDQSREMAAFWSSPRRFFIPAFALPANELTQLGAKMLTRPPELAPGSPFSFEPVTILPNDLQPLAEFIVLEVEAARSDKLRQLDFTLTLGEPELWALP